MRSASRAPLLFLLSSTLAAGLLGSCTRDTNLRAPAGTAPAPGQLEAGIAAEELARRPSAKLRALLESGAPEVRTRAALALGRIGDEEAAASLGALLAQPGTDGAMAAWALGRVHPAGVEELPGAPVPPGSSAAERLLRDCLARRCPQEVAAARALGKAQRSKESLVQLAAALAGPPALAAEAALSLGILARLGGKGADALVAEVARAGLWRALARSESEVRRGAAYALGRIPRPAPLAPASGKEQAALPVELDAACRAALVAALRDPEAETRAAAARAAGKQGLPAQELAGLLGDPDWRVRVEAARALSVAPGGPMLLEPAIRVAAEELARAHEPAAARWAHPLVELFAAAGARKGGAEWLPVPATLSGPTAASTAAVRCAAAEARDRLSGAPLETPACAAGLEPGWRSRFRTAGLAADLAGDHPESPAGRALLEALVDTDPRVRSAAAQGASPAFAAALLERLDDPDPVVLASAAGALAKDPAVARAALPAASRAAERLFSARSFAAGDPRADALGALVDLFAAALAPAPAPAAAASSTAPVVPPAPHPLPPEALGLRPLFSLEPPLRSLPLFRSLAALQPLLGAAPPSAALAPAPQIPSASAAGRPGAGPRLRTLVLTTTAGDLRVHLFTEDGDTPLTAAALATLATQGFYDGLLWHRVVPDFVAQGGDPLGDGEGGPGWALPDEHTARPFVRGALGIATSGPETGGSQIFLCHSAQPHLDGRYTVAGQLESGEQAMDALNVGDRILSARAE